MDNEASGTVYVTILRIAYQRNVLTFLQILSGISYLRSTYGGINDRSVRTKDTIGYGRYRLKWDAVTYILAVLVIEG